VSAAVLLALALIGVQTWARLYERHEAVITGAAAHLRLAPNEASPSATLLPPGLIVAVRDTWREWARIDTDSGIGWVPATAITRVHESP